MVFIAPFVGAVALFSGFANGLPRPDSSINEPAVSAPNGTPITASSSPSQTASSDMSGSDMSMSDSSMSSSNYGSSSGSMNYGSSDSSSSYGGSSSSYGSSSSNYGSDSSYGSSSGSYGSSGDYGSSGSYGSNYGGNSWDTTVTLATSTSTSWQSYSTPSYGSGTSNWGNSGYNDCVQQCLASYGGLPPTATYAPSATMGSDSYSGSSGGSGATHTVIVAPTQGVLRYVPFVVNASVGDTIAFMWGANNHTVTKSSELTPCNKTSDSPFTSGEQNKGFMFTQVVNDTNPTFFYCGTPTHCQKGMFGIINPPNAFNSPTSVSGMMQTLAANDSNVAAYAAYTDMQTANNSAAAKWGGNIDMTSLPEWSHSLVAENVLYTRNFLAANAETLKDDGSVDLSASGSTPLMIPQDLSAVLASSPSSASSQSAASTPDATPAAAATSPAASAPAANAQTTPTTSGAISISSSKIVVGMAAALATFMML